MNNKKELFLEVDEQVELETFYAPWDSVSKEVLSKPYKNFLIYPS